MNFYNVMHDKRYQALSEAIGFDMAKKKVIAVVGAGGKTTLIETLAKEFSTQSLRVIVTTTTHMRMPKAGNLESKVISELFPGEIRYIGEACEDGKFKQSRVFTIAEMKDKSDIILIEADGSRGKPLKVPAEHEPVIPMEADFVIGVLGYCSVGKKIADVAHRVKDVVRFLEKAEQDVVTEQDLVKISFHKSGLLKNVTVPYYVIWNRWNQEPIENLKNNFLILAEELC